MSQPSSWLSYPENKPTADERYQDFFIAYRNPRFIAKLSTSAGFRDIPPYVCDVSQWNGEKFSLMGKNKVTHFMRIPPIPTQGE